MLSARSLVVFALFLGACSSSSSSKSSNLDASPPDAKDSGKKDVATDDASETPEAAPPPDVILDPKNCVATTAKSSAEGVGGYCSPSGGQCLHARTGGAATLCTADFGAPAHEWFCTISCSTTSDCGTGGGTCLQTPFAQICVPASCSDIVGDAATTDGGDGGGGDAATDDSGPSDADRDALGVDATLPDAGDDAKVDALESDAAVDAGKVDAGSDATAKGDAGTSPDAAAG